MLRIAICDDDINARDALHIQLESILMEKSEKIVYEFASGQTAVNWLLKHPGEIDLLFLDVEMPGVNGMETAERIREFDKNMMLVFVTGYADYVFDGYRVGALDYVIKPAGRERLYEIMKRVREQIFSGAEKNFVFQNTDGTYRFSYEEILYFYSERRQVTIVTERGNFTFYGKLNQVEGQTGEDFVRIHQRYLVNGKKVSHIGSTSLFVGAGDKETELPISRGLRETASSKLARILLRG